MAEGGKPQALPSCSNLNCGICLEQYKEPKILPCSHTFCLACLEKTLKSREKEKTTALGEQTPQLEVEPDGQPEEADEVEFEITEEAPLQQISCPVCKRVHIVPVEGLSHLPLDLEAVQVIELETLQKSLSKSKVSQKCASCSKERDITNHCDQCGGICKRCCEAHEEFVLFAEHKVVAIEDITDENFGPKMKTHLCSRHREKATMYCNSCSQVICHICIVKQHQRHSVSLLEEADEKLQDKIRQQSESVQTTKKVFEEYRQYIAGVEGEGMGESYNAKLRAKVNQEFDERIKRLQVEQERLVKHIDDYDSLSKKQVWSEKETIELVLNKIQAGLKMMEKAQRCINMADRIEMNSIGSKILDEVRTATWSHKSLPHPLVFQSESVSQWSIDELMPITEKDISISVVDENGRKVTTPKIGQPTIIEVTFKVGMVDEPNFQILYGKSRQVLDPITAYEIASRSWNIEFVPRCAGVHLVQVWLGGMAVAIKDDISINGTPNIGEKVQPGPDWMTPNDDMLYLEGTVTDTNFSSIIEVEWKQEETNVEAVAGLTEKDREELLIDRTELEHKYKFLYLACEVPPGISYIPKEEGSVTPNENISTTEEEMPPELSLFEEDVGIEDDEPRTKGVCRKHQWGGLGGKYEIELILGKLQ